MAEDYKGVKPEAKADQEAQQVCWKHLAEAKKSISDFVRSLEASQGQLQADAKAHLDTALAALHASP